MNSAPGGFCQRRGVLLVGLLLFLGTWVIYWRAGSFEFVSYDDPRYVPENAIVQRGLTWEGLKWAFSNHYVGHWHPLTWISHMAVCEFFGTAPGAHHRVNVFLHAVNAVLFFLVLRRLTGALACGAFAAALFAWHPLRVESVAWVAEHKDVLAGLFWLLTIWAYAWWAERPGAGRYGLMVGLFVVGLLCKAILITLPFVLLLLDFWPLRRAARLPWIGAWAESDGKSLVGLIYEKLPLFALVVVSCVVTFLAGQGAGVVFKLPLMARVDNALVSYARYVGKFFWPVDLAVLYPHPGWWPKLQVLGAAGTLVVVTALVMRGAHKRPYLLVGWLWFLGVLVPVIGFIQAGKQAMADRYSYIPMLGLAVMVTWGAAEIVKRVPFGRWAAGLAGAAVLFALALGTSAQLQHWQNSVALFEHTVRVTRNNETAHYNLAQALSVRGDIAGAMPHYEAALRIDPGYDAAHNNLGLCHATLGRLDVATNHYAAALRANSDNWDAHFNYGRALGTMGKWDEAVGHYEAVLRLNPQHLWAHYWMAGALSALGKLDEAVLHYSETLRIKPDCEEAHYEMGLALARQAKTSAAVTCFLKAIELKPDRAESHAQLAAALVVHRQWRDAVTYYRQALRLNSNLIEALNNFAWMLATCPEAELRNGNEAVELAGRACKLTNYKAPLLIGTLAAACAEAGKFEDAVKFARQAHDVASAFGQKEIAARNLELQRLYQERKPFREE